MKTTFFLSVALATALAGCAMTLSHVDLEDAQAECRHHGGLLALSKSGRTLTAHCMNDTEHSWTTRSRQRISP